MCFCCVFTGVSSTDTRKSSNRYDQVVLNHASYPPSEPTILSYGNGRRVITGFRSPSHHTRNMSGSDDSLLRDIEHRRTLNMNCKHGTSLDKRSSLVCYDANTHDTSAMVRTKSGNVYSSKTCKFFLLLCNRDKWLFVHNNRKNIN